MEANRNGGQMNIDLSADSDENILDDVNEALKQTGLQEN
jgi:hypothetical protein